MEEVLKRTNQIDESTPELAKERKISEVIDSTYVTNAGKNLIGIAVYDYDSIRAYEITEAMTNVFISYSIEAKQKESQDAYNFINSQVLSYQGKLKAAEEALKVFNSTYIDATPGSQAEVSARIVGLRRQLEATQLALRELKIKRETIRKQLSGEAVITENLTREGQYRDRLAGLEERLESLRLVYHDTYPDIVAIKSQIEGIETVLEARQAREQGGIVEKDISSAATTSLLYQELRSQFSASETEIASLNARVDETQQMLKREQQRIVKINDVEAQLAELTRDYDVNQELYQSLSRQRENARISMNIDQENQGLTFKVQEPPTQQLEPEGIRFAHFLAAGLMFSFAIPIGIIFLLTLVDQKVRMQRVVAEELGLPVLASVYHMNTPTEYNLNTFKKSLVLLVIVMCLLIYGYAAWLRVGGGL